MRTKDDIFSNIPPCSICGDKRVVSYVDPVFGTRYRECSCMRYKARVAALRRSQIPDSRVVYEFSDYICGVKDADIDMNTKGLSRIEKYLANHASVVRNGADLNIFGGLSCGKTMLGCILLRDLILDHGYTGRFITAEDLVCMANDRVRFNSSVDDEYESLFEVDFLMVDNIHDLVNLDDKRIGGTAYYYIQNLFTRRKGAGKSFIVTSRCSPEHLFQKVLFLQCMLCTTLRVRLTGNHSKSERLRLMAEIGFGD